VIVGSPAAVLANYEVIPGGSMRVADVEAQEVLLKPRHEARWPVRLWMDKRTGLIVKCQKLDREGRTVEQAAFTALNFSPKPGPASSQPSYPGAKDWTVYNASFQPTGSAPALKFKPEALRGFELVGSYERHGSAGLEMRRYVFSDGVAAVTVFVGPKIKDSPLGDKAHRTGAVSMASREFQDVRVTVFGDVPPEALRQFVQSIEWKTNL
jgi:negative regulator of sigma E activity